MKAPFPLFAKVLLGFLVNVAVLVLAAWLLLRAQFHFGLDMLLAGAAGERLQAMAEIILGDLQGRPSQEWDEILARHGAAYDVRILLLTPDGRRLAGPDVALPGRVREHLRRLGPPRGPERMRPRGGDPGVELRNPRGPERQFPPRREDSGRFPAGEPFEPGPGPQRMLPPLPEGPRPVRREFVRTADPVRYWALLRVELPGDDRRQAGTLVVQSETLSAGGLFLDYVPWLWAGVGVLGFSILCWLPLVRGITRAIAQMQRATANIADGRFNVRVDERRRDELGQLGADINRMAARLAGLVAGQKRFLGDTAHELCAPIARLQMALGILEQNLEGRHRTQLEDLREEVQQISDLVNELLSFSKAGLHPKGVVLQPVALADCVRAVVRREAGESGAVQVNIAEDLRVLAEPELLSRALANVLRNALRYAGAGGPISIQAAATEGRVRLRVVDEGPGVPEDVLPRLFDPFFRLENSRSRETGGTGLGLAIVKTCVEACQGTVTARNRLPHGLEVEIRLGQPGPDSGRP